MGRDRNVLAPAPSLTYAAPDDLLKLLSSSSSPPEDMRGVGRINSLSVSCGARGFGRPKGLNFPISRLFAPRLRADQLHWKSVCHSTPAPPLLCTTTAPVLSLHARSPRCQLLVATRSWVGADNTRAWQFQSVPSTLQEVPSLYHQLLSHLLVREKPPGSRHIVLVKSSS